MINKYILIIIFLFITGCSNSEDIADAQKINSQGIDYSRAAKYNLQLGLGYLQQGDVERAKGKLLKALEQAPKMPEAHYNIAHFYYLIDELDLADQHFQSSIYYARGNSKGVLGTSHNNYGVFLCQTKRYQEALKHFDSAIADSRYADTASAFENAGLCLLKQDNKSEAKYYFEKAIKQNPLSTKALIEVVDLYITDKEYDKAKLYLSRYEQLTKSTKRSMQLKLKLATMTNDQRTVDEISAVLFKKYPNLETELNNQYNKLVKYTDIGELNSIA